MVEPRLEIEGKTTPCHVECLLQEVFITPLSLHPPVIGILSEGFHKIEVLHDGCEALHRVVCIVFPLCTKYTKKAGTWNQLLWDDDCGREGLGRQRQLSAEVLHVMFMEV